MCVCAFIPSPYSPQQDLGKYLSLSLNDYTIHFQGVYESAPHTVVEFYAVDSTTGKLMNVSDAWKKLTENGQDYKILHYHVVQVEMKGQFGSMGRCVIAESWVERFRGC